MEKSSNIHGSARVRRDLSENSPPHRLITKYGREISKLKFVQENSDEKTLGIAALYIRVFVEIKLKKKHEE